MDDKQLVKLGLPGVGHAIAAHSCPQCSWDAHGVQIYPEGGGVGIRAYHGSADMGEAAFGCTTCGWGSQPWSKWVSLARRIIDADEAMRAARS